MKRRTKLLLTFSAVIGLFALFQVVPAIEAILNATRCQVSNRIVYTSMREYVPPFLFNQAETICSDGSGTVYQRLPSQLKDATTLAFSPDGSRVAFESKGSLFIMSADGSNLVPLTGGYDMAWSPDGRKLAFTRVITVSKSGYGVQGIFDTVGEIRNVA